MYKSASVKGRRNNQSGSMLILVCLAMMVLSIAVVMAASFAGVFFTHSRLQSGADEIALEGARKLNEFNRLGQMNDMIARSRQLVFGINKQTDLVASYGNDPVLEKLTRQLNDEARQGAQILEEERHKLSSVAKGEAKAAMQEKFRQVSNNYAMVLPWLMVQTPQMVLNDTGAIVGMQSNAQELQGFEELVGQDAKNVFSGKPVNLYRAEVDAKLPIANSPSFLFSPLAAAVVNDMAPARAVLPESFRPIDGDFAPCAARVGLNIKVGTGLGPAAQGELKVLSAATATGGGLWQ